MIQARIRREQTERHHSLVNESINSVARKDKGEANEITEAWHFQNQAE